MSRRVTNASLGGKRTRKEGVSPGSGPWNSTPGSGGCAHMLPTQNLRTSWLASMNTNSEGQMGNGGKCGLQWRERWISLLRNQLLDITWRISTELGTGVQFKEERGFPTACLWITVSRSDFQKPPSAGFWCWPPAFLGWPFLWTLPSTLLWTFYSYSIF